MPDLDLILDVFGQRRVSIFTQISFCFPTNDAHPPQSILDILTGGLQRLAKHFPWIAGQVVREDTVEGGTVTFRIRPLDATPRLFVKDLRSGDSKLSMINLRQAGFPMSAFDEDVIAPRRSYSGHVGEKTAEVFQLQVNLIEDGLILTFLGQHQAMDGIGQAEVMRLFSKACRGEPFTEAELRVGNFAPENVVPLHGDPWSPGPELSYNIIKSNPSEPGFGGHRTIFPAEQGIWSHFSLSAASLGALKSLASETLPPTANYVSTDDVVSAFVWRSITLARSTRSSGVAESLFARAVDLRKCLNIAPSHPGFVQSMTYHKFAMQQLIDSPLGVISADLRRALDPPALAHHSRSFATLISRTSDETLTSYLAGFDMSRDVMLSSWVNQTSYELDFGLGLGHPEAVRRPRFDSFQGLVYLLPRAPSGEIDVVMCLSHGDTEKLRGDKQFTKYATYIG
ncbi:putative trichothecene 3-O-acetyltransferase [Thozetella sp. PMI_491]|nr:putative trichothecene 3-O-acetyltransferase [Thozetella sp. PMI_491]